MREVEYKPITNERVFLKDSHDKSVDDVDVFQELFGFALQEMATVYKIHREKKGDSWKDAPVEYLRVRLEEEIKEWSDSKDDTRAREKDLSSLEYNELTDILNIGFMLLERLLDERTKTPDWGKGE